MSVNAAQNFMNQAAFHSTFPILVITKIFAEIQYQINQFLINVICYREMFKNHPILKIRQDNVLRIMKDTAAL